MTILLLCYVLTAAAAIQFCVSHVIFVFLHCYDSWTPCFGMQNKVFLKQAKL